MSIPCAKVINISKIIEDHDSRARGSNREAYLERKLLSMARKLKEERATRTAIEQSLAAVQVEIQRLKLLISNSNTGSHERRKVLRALLLCFHPDKVGEDTMLSSTAVTQIITQQLEENGD